MDNNIILATTFEVAGRNTTSTLGLVRGNTIRARHLGSDIGAGLKGLVGGEIRGYVKAMSEAREEALTRMIKEAEALGADAVVGVRFTTSSIMGGASEVLAYGTAVKLGHE